MDEAKQYTPEAHAALMLELQASETAMMKRLANAEHLIATLVVNSRKARKGADFKAICEFIAKVDVPAYLDGKGLKMLPGGVADAPRL